MCIELTASSKMSYDEMSSKLAGPIGLMKQYAPPFVYVRSISQIIVHLGSSQDAAGRPPKTLPRSLVGGRSLRVEWARSSRMYVSWFPILSGLIIDVLNSQYHRTSPFDAILGGAEDVLGDLGVRQAVKKMPPNVRL